MCNTKNSLVLSGGNVKGAYQAGAVKALLIIPSKMAPDSSPEAPLVFPSDL